jgi:ribosomal protein S18 acetylase RimI-like enzyme
MFSGPELVAVGFIHPDAAETGTWRVRGMATLPHARGRGAGTAVLAALLEYAAAHGATSVWCSVRIAATTLYERAGFRVVSDRVDVPEIGPHLVMELELAARRR